MKHLIGDIKRGFIHAVFGLIFGDEGKGKAILDLIKLNGYTANARWQGGRNAGHSLSLGNGKVFVAHLLPSGCIIPDITLLLGNDMAIDPTYLRKEIKQVEDFGIKVRQRIHISKYACITTPYHPIFDRVYEWLSKNPVGTTGVGIGPTFADRYLRKGLRMGQILNIVLFNDQASAFLSYQQTMLKAFIGMGFEIKASEEEALNDQLIEWKKSIIWIRKTLKIVDMQEKIEELLASGEKILAEGAQGLMLDINEGDYPFVTATMTGPAGIFSGLSTGPKDVTKYYGVMKPYNTKVGGGPFPSRMDEYYESLFQEKGNEFGATTGRPRMCGWPDLVIMRHVVTMFIPFGTLHIILTKCDSYPDELVDKPMWLVTHHIINGKETDTLHFPLSDITDVTKTEITKWKIARGATSVKGNLDICLFINTIRNRLYDLDEIGAFKFVLIGTGPELGEIAEYQDA
jgi:adenylosuccinate synthase